MTLPLAVNIIKKQTKSTQDSMHVSVHLITFESQLLPEFKLLARKKLQNAAIHAKMPVSRKPISQGKEKKTKTNNIGLNKLDVLLPVTTYNQEISNLLGRYGGVFHDCVDLRRFHFGKTKEENIGQEFTRNEIKQNAYALLYRHYSF
uniref:Uncharacterized protein n=1 Tax=Glossina palpalis gambiensis TaxID=67801 RepID=A0A1B0B336_9MUSC